MSQIRLFGQNTLKRCWNWAEFKLFSVLGVWESCQMTPKLAAWSRQVPFEKISLSQKGQDQFHGWTHRIHLLPFQIMVVPSALLLIAVEEGQFAQLSASSWLQLAIAGNWKLTAYFRRSKPKEWFQSLIGSSSKLNSQKETREVILREQVTPSRPRRPCSVPRR